MASCNFDYMTIWKHWDFLWTDVLRQKVEPICNISNSKKRAEEIMFVLLEHFYLFEKKALWKVNVGNRSLSLSLEMYISPGFGEEFVLPYWCIESHR